VRRSYHCSSLQPSARSSPTRRHTAKFGPLRH